MTEIAELERRISVALERIGRGVETLITRPQSAAVPEPEAALPAVEAPDPGEVEALREALEAERVANAQLSERVRAIREKQETTLSALEKRLAQATKAFETMQSDATRLKRANADLTETNRALVEAAGDVPAHLVNRAMQAELESLRAARAWEASELDEIIAGIEPLIAAHAKEAESNA